MLFAATPVYSVENEANIIDPVENIEITQESPVVWYKDHAVQIAAAAITTAAAIYALAVYKGKISSPAALWAGLFCSHIAKTIATESKQENENTVSNDNSVIVVADNNSGNNIPVKTDISEVAQQDSTPDNQLNEDNNKQETNVTDNVLVDQQSSSNEQDSQNTEIKITEQKDVVAIGDSAAIGDTVVEPKIDVLGKAKSLFAQFKKDASQWVTSDEI